MISVDASAYLALDADAHRNPQALFDGLRALKAIHRDPTTGYYIVVDPETIRAILQDPDTYSSADAFSPALTQATHYLIGALSDEQRQHFVSPVVSIMTSDGAAHQRLRRAVNSYFSKDAMSRRFPTIRAKAATVLDTLGTDIDWVQDFCMPFSVQVIADLLGVLDNDYDTITRWDALLTSLGGGAITPDAIYAYLDFTKEFTEYFSDRSAHLADDPDASLLSHLLQQGDNLTDHERIQILLLLLAAGSGSTVILFTYIAIRLAANPDLIQQLRIHPHTIPAFVEDCVAQSTPTANIFRTTTREVTLQDTPIPAGSYLMLSLAAAHQNLPKPTSHLAFGRGVHLCLGAQLARTEAHAMVEEIVLRYRRITVTQPLASLPFHPHIFIPGYPHLPVHLERCDPMNG